MALLMVEFPRSYAFVPGTLSLIAIFIFCIVQRTLPVIPCKVLFALLATVVLALVSSLWSVSMEVSLERSMKMIPLLFAGLVVITCFSGANNFKPEKVYRLFAIAIVSAAILTIFELNSDRFLYRVLRDLTYNDKVPLAVYNRGTIILLLCSIPVLSYLYYIVNKRVFSFIVLLPLMTLLALTDSQSSQLAAILSAVAFFLFPYKKQFAWYLFMVVFCALVLVAPILAPFLYSKAELINSLPLIGGNQGYAGPRLEIWDYVARYSQQSPFWGFGIEATKVITDFDSREVYISGNSILHPHNFALQIWIEFGILGAILLCLLCTWLLIKISQIREINAQRVCFASFIAVVSISATGYGIWQSWWLGSIFLTAGNAVYFISVCEQES